MAQTKAQKKRAIEGKKRNTVKSCKYKGLNVEITKTSNGKKCNMCGKNYHDFGDYSGYCPKCAKGFYKELQDDMDSQDELDAKIDTKPLDTGKTPQQEAKQKTDIENQIRLFAEKIADAVRRGTDFGIS